jgi:hypothetical protein
LRFKQTIQFLVQLACVCRFYRSWSRSKTVLPFHFSINFGLNWPSFCFLISLNIHTLVHLWYCFLDCWFDRCYEIYSTFVILNWLLKILLVLDYWTNYLISTFSCRDFQLPLVQSTWTWSMIFLFDFNIWFTIVTLNRHLNSLLELDYWINKSISAFIYLLRLSIVIGTIFLNLINDLLVRFQHRIHHWDIESSFKQPS